MTRQKKSWLRRWWAAVLVGALLVGAGGYLLFTRVVQPPSAEFAPQLPWPPGVAAPKFDMSALPTTPPWAHGNCPAPKLAGKRGAWVVSWLNDSAAPDLVARQAARLDLLDFFWASIAGPRAPQQSDPSVTEPSLGTELAAAQGAKKCGLRFATITDNASGLSPKANARMMARIITNPKVQWQFVQAVANWTAGQPLLDGVTLDAEYALPESMASATQPDIATYEQVAGWGKLPVGEAVNRIRNGYTNLTWALGAAMHHQHRLFRVATVVQLSDVIDDSHIAPSVIDDGAIAKHVDQIVVMAYNFSYSTSDPGAIAPQAKVAQALDYVHSYGVPWHMMAAGVPAYAYNWQVGLHGHIAKNHKGNIVAATDLTPTQIAGSAWLAHAGKVILPGGVYYSYSRGGHTHIVWDSAGVLGPAVHKIGGMCPGCGVMVWKVGNADPVGWHEISRVLG